MNKTLILGGTNFIGRNLVERLIHLDSIDLTLFNRGLTNPNLFPNVRKVTGDRNSSDIKLIFKEKWNYIIDLSCYYPDSLSNIVNSINQDLKRYIFISTCSVYDNKLDKTVLRKENSPILNCDEKECIDSSLATYGKRKAECERILQRSGITYSIFRPALVYGKYDNTDRFYYWLYQAKKCKNILIPNRGENLFSVTYVKDLIQVIMSVIQSNIISDVYNITTCPKLSISKITELASKILGTQPDFYSAGSEFLEQNNIAQWTDLPLWLDCDYFTYDKSKAIDNLGLEITDFETSLVETIEYYKQLDWPKPQFGITDEIKESLVAKLVAN